MGMESAESLIREHTKNARQFLNEMSVELNDNGIPIFVSSKGNNSINLELFLADYEQFLIDEKILKEV